MYRPTIPKWLYSSSSSARRVPLGDAADRVQPTHARVAEPAEHELACDARGDHLVVDEVGGHAGQGQIAPSLADDLVPGSEADEVREPLDGHRVAIAHEVGDGVAHRGDLGGAAAHSRDHRMPQGSRIDPGGPCLLSLPLARPRPLLRVPA